MSTRTRLLKMKMRIMVKRSKTIIEMVFRHLLDTQKLNLFMIVVIMFANSSCLFVCLVVIELYCEL